MLLFVNYHFWKLHLKVAVRSFPREEWWSGRTYRGKARLLRQFLSLDEMCVFEKDMNVLRRKEQGTPQAG